MVLDFFYIFCQCPENLYVIQILVELRLISHECSGGAGVYPVVTLCPYITADHLLA